MSFLRSIALAAASIALFACAGDAVECITDGDCAEGQYCVSTRCADPTPVADDREAYMTQVAPVIETGCNCHGPGTGRPYSFTHDFDDPAALDADLAVLRQWLYDPVPDAEEPRPTAWLYGLAGCGFNHPGIYAGPLQPQYTLLIAWAKQARENLPVIAADAVEPPPVTPPAGGPLPDLEVDALARIRSLPYARGMAEEVVPRVVGQCGCCHAGDGDRGWKLYSAYGADETDRAARVEQDIGIIEGFANRDNPDQASLLRYGLGANGAVEAHPRIYSGPDDPRYRFLRQWMLQGPRPE